MSFCPRTGGSVCLCDTLPRTKIGVGMLLDLKSALRRVFGEHTLYTGAFIVASLPDKSPDADIVSTRLLQNPADIANLLRPIVGPQLADDINDMFTKHLMLAAAGVEAVRGGNKQKIDQASEYLLNQGDDVAAVISAINIDKLPLHKVEEEFYQHNSFVLELAGLRAARKYEEYITLFDTYRAHMDMLSDLIYNALQ